MRSASPDLQLPPPGPQEPVFVPDPVKLGMESFFVGARQSERLRDGIDDGMTLVVTEPLVEPGETVEQTWGRLSRQWDDETQTRAYQESPEQVALAFFYKRWETPTEEEQIVAPESERTEAGFVRHTIKIMHANELLIAEDTPTHIGLPNAHIGSGGRYRKPFWGWDTDFDAVGLQAMHDARRLRNAVENQAHAIRRRGKEPNSLLRVIDRGHPPLFGHSLRRLAIEEGPHVYEEFLPALVQNWVTWTSGRVGLGDVKLGETAMNGDSFKMEDGSFLEGIGVTGDTPRPEMFLEDLVMAELHADALELTDPAAREQAKKDFYASVRGGAMIGNDFHGGLLRDGKSLHSIDTVGRIPVNINSLLAHDELLMSEIYASLGDNMMAELMHTQGVTRIRSMRRFLRNPESKTYQDRYVDGRWAPQDANMAYMLYNGLASEDEIPGIRRALEEYVHPGGVVTTLNTSEHSWGAMADWPMTAYMVIRGLGRAGHGVRDEQESVKSLRLATRAWEGHHDGDLGSFQTTGQIRERVNALKPGEAEKVRRTGEYNNIGNFPTRGLVALGLAGSPPWDRTGGSLPYEYTVRHDVLENIA